MPNIQTAMDAIIGDTEGRAEEFLSRGGAPFACGPIPDGSFRIVILTEREAIVRGDYTLEQLQGLPAGYYISQGRAFKGHDVVAKILAGDDPYTIEDGWYACGNIKARRPTGKRAYRSGEHVFIVN